MTSQMAVPCVGLRGRRGRNRMQQGKLTEGGGSRFERG